MYFVKFDPDTVKTFNNVYCIGLQNFTRNCNYCICKETSDSETPGLRIFDMDAVIRKEQHCLTLLKSIDIGSAGQFEFSAATARFGFISSLTNGVVTPLLHRNVNKMIGFPYDEDILCYKVIKDKIVVLTNDGTLGCWNILTAKPVSQVKINFKELGIDNCERISLDKGSEIVLRSKMVEHGINTDTFFMPSQLSTNTKNQKPYVKTVTTDPRKHKILEIMSEKKVFIHMNFVFPAQKDDQLYVNKVRNLMIQKLTGHRAFLYRAMIDNPVEPRQIRWELIR